MSSLTPLEMKEREIWQKAEHPAKTFAGILHTRLWINNKNFLVAIVGEPGVGKSYTALTLGCMIDLDFNISNVAWDVKEFLEALDKAKRGSVLVFDEAGVGIPARDWQTIQNKVISYVMQTFRYKNVGVIFTTPNLTYIDKQVRGLINYTIKVLDRRNEATMCVIYRKESDPVFGIVSWTKWTIKDEKEAREIDPNPVFFPKPPEDLASQYEAKSKEFKDKVREDALATYEVFMDGASTTTRIDGRTIKKYMNQVDALARLYYNIKKTYNLSDGAIARMMDVSTPLFAIWKKEWLSKLGLEQQEEE